MNGLRRILGTDRNRFSAKFIYLGDDESETVVEYGFVTWYDARENHPTRSEYRLYYPATAISDRMSENDLLVIGKLPDDSIMVIVVRTGTAYENNVLWLFGLQENDVDGVFTVQEIFGDVDAELNYAMRVILTELGIEITEVDENYLEMMLQRFNGRFPHTRIFSAFARETVADVSSLDDPDVALLAWLDHEELLFRTLERHLVSDQVYAGFENVDHFISYSLGVQNRRKSRAGYALENHIEQIFVDRGIAYTREGITENRSKPDFVFPGIDQYHHKDFPTARLTMLGAKSTCKDRWRQVLSEAVRIPEKHLLTLEPGISENQTNEMRGNNLQLVLPESLHSTYNANQQNWIMNVQGFLKIVYSRQSM